MRRPEFGDLIHIQRREILVRYDFGGAVGGHALVVVSLLAGFGGAFDVVFRWETGVFLPLALGVRLAFFRRAAPFAGLAFAFFLELRVDLHRFVARVRIAFLIEPVLPEYGVENHALVLARDEIRLAGDVDVVEIRGVERIETAEDVDDATRGYLETRAPEDAAKADHLTFEAPALYADPALGQGALNDGANGSCHEVCPDQASGASCAVATMLSRPSLSTRLMSSWYFRMQPMVSRTASASSSLRCSARSACAQSRDSATPGRL